jgi:hypothetical protein
VRATLPDELMLARTSGTGYADFRDRSLAAWPKLKVASHQEEQRQVGACWTILRRLQPTTVVPPTLVGVVTGGS